MSKIYCAHTDVVATDSLIENPRNPNRHPEDQIIALAKIIRHQGWRNPIVVSRRSGFVVKGHGRLLAARMLGLDTVPVDYQDYENEAAEWADMVADNKIAELSNMDEEELNAIIRELDGQIDLELTGFQTSEINNILSQIEEMNEVPDSVPLDADNDSTVTNLPFISYGAKKIYMQPDEVERFEKLLKDYSSVHGNYNGLALELMEYGDSNFRNKPDAE
ncbi:MAG: ParB N-terminal domain-containing protein [Akkermansia sp.]|nr:ParB N-terminal domain-containing protein [Akkermansia sp.]